MEYVSVAKMAEKWGLSERSVRNYCANGRIADAKLIGKTWYIPENAQKPDRVNKKKDTPSLLQILREQKAAKMTGGIYHKVQIDLTYNSNHIEGSRLTHDQTRYMRAYATNLLGTVYGEETSFTSSTTPPGVTTDNVTNITQTSASCGGAVTYAGGAAVTAKGLCYGTSENPTTNDNTVAGGTGIGAFTGDPCRYPLSENGR